MRSEISAFQVIFGSARPAVEIANVSKLLQRGPVSILFCGLYGREGDLGWTHVVCSVMMFEAIGEKKLVFDEKLRVDRRADVTDHHA